MDKDVNELRDLLGLPEACPHCKTSEHIILVRTDRGFYGDQLVAEYGVYQCIHPRHMSTYFKGRNRVDPKGRHVDLGVGGSMYSAYFRAFDHFVVVFK